LKSAAALAAVGGAIFLAGCGDTFRPIESAIPKPGGDPKDTKFAVVISNSAGVQGNVQEINVSGDSVVAQLQIGRTPMNEFVDISRTITANADGSVSILATLSTNLAVPVTISLPAGANPSSVTATGAFIYVADPTRNVVDAISLGTNVLAKEIPVGLGAISVVALPNNAKIYAMNRNDNTVSSISTTDNTVTATIPVGSAPIFAAASPDSTRLYVVNQGGSVSVIDTAVDAVLANGTVNLGGAPNTAVFSPALNRLFITNSGTNTLASINADPSSPAYLAVTVIPVGTTPVGVTVLANGAKAYVANSGSNDVSVVNATSNTVVKTIPVGTLPVSIASAPDSSKVYVVNQTSQNTSIIRTLDDTEIKDANGNIFRIRAAKVDPICVDTATATCARQSPTQVVVTP
jgi:YVTN family beta-propeller protein